MNAIFKQPVDTTAALARGAMLVDLTFRQWTGRKKNREVSDEVVQAKGANSRNAATVYNALLGDCKELHDISKFVSMARANHLKLTLPWSDAGTRLLPVTMLDKYQAFIEETRDTFDDLVLTFLNKYNTQVTAAAFELGSMFDRDNYPDRDELVHKFGLRCSFSPVPLAGDFRVDLDTEMQQKMAAHYEEVMFERMSQAQQDMWTRLHETLTHMVDRLGGTKDGKPNVFKNTLVSNAEELIDLMALLNPTKDPALENARLRLQDALRGKTPEVLRTSEESREGTKQKLQEILDAFDFGL